MSECTHDCSSCGESCGERANPQDFRKPANELSSIKKVIAVVSGKGGVGKSAVTEGGIELMSLNLLMERETDPVVWRGPVIAGAVEQFWTDVVWGELDYLFVDMPPGTGDVPLTVFQSLPVDGVIVVSAPQTLVGMIVTKAVRMAEMMNVPVLGLVENYSFFRCPGCGGEHPVFGESTIDALGAHLSLPVLAKLPLDPALARAVDAGKVEGYEPNPMKDVAELLDKE